MHVRYDAATRRVNHVSVVPFTKPLATGEVDIEIADAPLPNVPVLRLTDDLATAEPDPTAPVAPDRRKALTDALAAAERDALLPAPVTNVFSAMKAYLGA